MKTLGQQLIERGKTAGRIEGKIEGRVESLLCVLVARFHELPAPLTARLAALTDLATIDRLTSAAVTAEDLGEFERALDR